MPLLTAFTDVFASLSTDGRRLFGARCLRLFAYGFLSVVLVFYLTGVGVDERRTGLLLSLTLSATWPSAAG